MGDHRAGDRDTLLHAARELPRVLRGDAVEAHLGEDGLGSRTPFLLRQLGATEWKHDVPNDGQPGEERAAVVLEHDCHFSRRCVHRLAVEQHDALGRWHQTADEAEERRLAAPRRTHDCQELALADVERDLGEG